MNIWQYNFFSSVTPEESCGCVDKMKQIIGKLVSQVNNIPSGSLPFWCRFIDPYLTSYKIWFETYVCGVSVQGTKFAIYILSMILRSIQITVKPTVMVCWSNFVPKNSESLPGHLLCLFLLITSVDNKPFPMY